MNPTLSFSTETITISVRNVFITIIEQIKKIFQNDIEKCQSGFLIQAEQSERRSTVFARPPGNFSEICRDVLLVAAPSESRFTSGQQLDATG